MTLVALTRLRIRSIRYLPGFYLNSWANARQLQATPGFLGGLLASEGSRAFWTFSLWIDEADMHIFRETDAHARAMPKLMEWCDEASVAHYFQDNSKLPSGAEALSNMVSHGRLSKVRHPSPDHALGRIASARREPKPGLQLRPKVSSAKNLGT